MVTTLCSSRTVQRHIVPCMCNQLNCCIKKCQTFLCPTCGLRTAQISVLWITRFGLSCSIVFTTVKSIVWMNWNGGSSMSGAVLNSWFLMRLLSSGKEDIEHVSTLKEDNSNAACELTMLILSISVTFNVTCLTVTSLITKSCNNKCTKHTQRIMSSVSSSGLNNFWQ